MVNFVETVFGVAIACMVIGIILRLSKRTELANKFRLAAFVLFLVALGFRLFLR